MTSILSTKHLKEKDLFKRFSDQKDAIEHEADMRIKLMNPIYTMTTSAGSKQTRKIMNNGWIFTAEAYAQALLTAINLISGIISLPTSDTYV